MKAKLIKLIVFLLIVILAGICVFAAFAVFFDQAVFTRQGTFYQARVSDKVVALTFDDGPSLKWTPLILDELKSKDVRATFFLIGEHVQQYPEITRQILSQGHDIGIHTFHHPNLLFAPASVLKKEITDTADLIKTVTGRTTHLFRPPKAWLTDTEKSLVKGLGYKIVLWSLNSKDWVSFDDKYIVNYIVKNIRPGDIILFHDSGGVFGIEGGDRTETIKSIARIIDKLKLRGYRFVTISELVRMDKANDQ
jgi:peptidoglycan/xylan/chitin deacetylase (PgdA/CDA1 family)